MPLTFTPQQEPCCLPDIRWALETPFLLFSHPRLSKLRKLYGKIEEEEEKGRGEKQGGEEEGLGMDASLI